MPFVMKDYGNLRESIDKLISSYSTALGRYTINEKTADGSVSEEPVDTLRLLIARVDEAFTACKSKRRTALDALTKLTNELREYIKSEDPDHKKRATQFLLGALLHRYFRIEKERASKAAVGKAAKKVVSSVIGYTPLAFFVKRPDTKPTSELYLAIEKILHINKQRMIDPMTIWSALLVFKNNMGKEIDVTEKEVTVKKERYKTYEHLNNDVNFKIHLDELINKYEILAAPTVKEFQAISFMQSLMTHVETQYGPFQIELLRWGTEFSALQKDWSKLDKGAMIEHINKFKADDSIKERIRFLVDNTDFRKVISRGSFLNLLSEMHTGPARSIIVGGFVVLSKYARFKDKKVLEHIAKEMGLNDPLSKENKRLCVEFFDDFLKEKANENLECGILEGRAKLLTKVSNLLKELTPKPPAESKSKVEVAGSAAAVPDIDGDTVFGI